MLPVTLFSRSVLLIVTSGATLLEARGHTARGGGSTFLAPANTSTVADSLRDALGGVLGCGGHVEQRRLVEIEDGLRSMWLSLPKNAFGQIDRPLMRYLASRYFTRESSMLIRGFELSRLVNLSSWGSATILDEHVPEYVESVLQSKHLEERGFGIQDATRVIATLEQLMFNSETELLEEAYSVQRKPVNRPLSREGLEQLIEEYMLLWVIGENHGIKKMLKNERHVVLNQIIPHWDQLKRFTHGQIRAYDYARQRAPMVSKRSRTNAMSLKYSFDDAHAVVGDIIRRFDSFWRSECDSMRETLIKLDTHGTGRVPLSQLYGHSLDGEWRFGESEAYLKELGALDETSTWLGKQVIIPNYIQGASNCIATQKHYLICCTDECEAIREEVESGIGSPAAPPDEILALVGNLSAQSTIDHDDLPKLDSALVAQLKAIAAAQGGKVPLQGRLFAQWLHYVFPRECPFPHKAGTVSASTPSQFGNGYIATDREMKAHSTLAHTIPPSMDRDELDWMSQWSSEEELIVDYIDHMQAHSWTHWLRPAGMLLFGILSALTGAVRVGQTTAKGCDGLAGAASSPGKTHFV